MCGICGLVGRDPRYAPDTGAVQQMMAALAHRGPDDAGLFTDGPAALGFRRLSIIDLQGGHQPMSNEDGSVWIVLNGEIYNYLELRQELIGSHQFRTASDTETVLHLYEEMGERCVERLNGMFAFAIWDQRRGRLFAARDRLGIKPFYWMQTGEALAFASEPKAFVAAGLLEPSADPAGLEQYLTFQFCLGAQTLFRGVQRLEPGHHLVFQPGRDREPVIRRYWNLDYTFDTHHTEEYYTDQVLELIRDAVRLQLRSDVPVGAHLSGGIDSSTVVSVAAGIHGGDFHTFTGGFREGPLYDETGYARAVASRAATVHHEVWPSATEFADRMPWLMYMMDEPAAGPGLFPQWAVSRLARQHVTVVLGGQGGDELFGGYARYLAAYVEQCLKGIIFGTQESGRHVVTWESIAPNLPRLREYVPLLQSFLREGMFEEMDRRYFRLVSRHESAGALFSGDVWTPDSQTRVFGEFGGIFNDPAIGSYFNRMTNFDLKTLLPSLLQVEDRTSMSVSLESRVPLLDHRLVELVTRMSPAMRFQGGDTKRVLREAVRPILPPEVVDRRDKMGFPVPLQEWAAGPLRDFLHDILLSPRARQRGVFQPAALERLVAGERRYGRELWGVLCLELWFRAFVDGEAVTPPLAAGTGGVRT
jgi:asparagine synthase (glutamine-hydrolysing)